MSKEMDWLRVSELFSAALEQPPEMREQFILQRCADATLERAELLAMLALHHADEADAKAGIGAALVEPVRAAKAAMALHTEMGSNEHQADDPLPADIGGYRLIRELGRGGMGIVYLAEREEQGARLQVALKLTPPHGDRAALRQRFLREREILARLHHPNIAHLTDLGVSANGQPWYAMEYVEGTPLSSYAAAQQLSLSARLELMLQLCAAVQYAHQNLVVHRDLKPGNILVDRQGNAKLLDFGIAKLIDQSEAMTQSRAPMTIAYAAPEQIRGEPITTLTDVYALGVILYELLTGVRPHHRQADAGLSIIQAITDTDPEAPSKLLERKTGQIPARALRGDLDVIVLKSLQREPARRYGSARELADDLSRFLALQPIHAQPDSWWYRSRKFLRRNRALSASTALLFFSVIIGAGLSYFFGVQARRAGEQALQQAQTKDAMREVMIEVFAAANPYRNSKEKFSVERFLTLAINRAEVTLKAQPELYLSVASDLAHAYFQAVDQLKGLAMQEKLIARAATTPGLSAEARLRMLLNFEHELSKLGREAQSDLVRQQIAPLVQFAREGSDLWFDNQLAAMRRLEPTRDTISRIEQLMTEPSVRSDRNRSSLCRQLLAQNFAFSGESAKASQLYSDIATDLRSNGTPLELARVLHNFAWTSPSKGEPQRQALTEAVAIYVSELGATHSDTLNARNILAGINAAMGDMRGAEAEFEAIIAAQRPMNGVQVVATLRNYNGYWMDRRFFANARKLVDEALQRTRELDPEGVQDMSFWVQIDDLWLRLAEGRTADFEPLLRAIKAKNQDPNVQLRLQWIQAQWRYQLGDFAASSALLAPIVDAEGLAGRRARVLLLQAKLALGMRENARAQTLLENALRIAELEPEPLATWIAEAQFFLAQSLPADASSQAQAKVLLQQSMDRIRQITPANDPWRNEQIQ